MFGLFKKQEKKKAAPATPVMSQASNKGISYDQSLIDQFEAEHQSLISLFGKIKTSAESQDFKGVQKYLKKFTSVLRGHLLTENVKLYVYLSKALANDIENKEIMMTFRQEMMQIGRVVNQFVTRYEQTIWDNDMKANFLDELLAIGDVLVRRIEQEESVLYPLYMPEDHYI